ncbi:MAG: MgtC/SapB family protein [Ruminococcaceae bacterium]|nr:MgtC/SapB family protein [Oscillospiraceae bacterium]
MEKFLETIYSFNEISMVLRLALAVICAGIVGIEREQKRRAAGFRTHILIAMGAAMTALLGQFLAQTSLTDPLRIGAQVVSGMGFIGAGTIIVTRRKEAKGLTTAASLWTTAIIGLAAGAGCYIEVLFCTFMIILAQLVFSKAEYYLIASSKIMNVYVDFSDKKEIYAINEKISEKKIEVLNTEINKSPDDDGISAVFTLKFPARIDQEEILRDIADLESVRRVEGL